MSDYEGSRIQASTAPAGVPAMSAAISAGSATQLPPPAAAGDPPDHSEQAANVTVLEGLLVVLTLALAFLLGSALARNSDLWLHLASGRQLLQGKASFGTESFTYAQEDAYWVNPSWLFDVAAYLIFDTFGAGALVAVKAGLIAVMAALMLLAARTTDKRLSLPVFCASLALVAMGPWLVLRPLCWSLLSFAWTIWYLERKGRPALSCWPLLVGFALWANVDRWFFLGPATVTLYALGRLISGPQPRQAGQSGRDDELAAWAVLCLASWTACLVNPHHVFVYTTMWDFWASDIALPLQADPFLRAHFYPLKDLYLSLNYVFAPAFLAFWLLVAGSFLSFLLGAWPWRWGLLWAFVALLCILKLHALPFFAMVAAIVLARNAGDWVRGRAFQANLRRALDLPALGRLLLLLLVVGLALAAWPGWLQGGAAGPRRWQAALDPSIEAAARSFAALTEQGKLPKDGRIFNFSPDTANYLAWLYPQAKCVINSHLHLSGEAAARFAAVREGLSGVVSPNTPVSDWRSILREDEVRLLLIHGGNPGSTLAAMRSLFQAHQECPLLILQGGAAMFGWRDPFAARVPDRFAGLVLDLRRQAFGGDATPLPSVKAPAAPESPGIWWEAFWRPGQSPSLEREEVRTLLTYFDAIVEANGDRYARIWRAKEYADFFVACGAPAYAWLFACGHEPNLAARQAFLSDQDDGPMAVLFLAVRQARRALHHDPANAQNHYLLGETYRRFGRHTRERSWGPLLGNLRTCQTLAAYRTAVELEPQNWRAQERLAEIFKSMDYKDLCLHYFRESVQHRAMAPGESRAQFRERLLELGKGVQALEKEVRALQGRWAVNSSNLRVSERADMAGHYGLPGKALEVLLASNIAAFGATGLEMELKLMLNSGDAAKVKQWLSPDHLGLLTDSTYYLVRAESEAALGNYAEAVQALQRVVMVRVGDQPVRPADLLGLTVGNTLLYHAGAGPASMLPAPTRFNFPGLESLTVQAGSLVYLMHQQASSRVLEGLLAVEAGENRRGEAAFRAALSFWNSEAGSSFADARSDTGRRIARYFISLLEAR